MFARRYDFIEVEHEDEDRLGMRGMDYPAQLLYFIAYKDLKFAVVRYYQPWTPLDPDLDVYVCTGFPEEFERGKSCKTFGVIALTSICCHAHLIPDFDAGKLNAAKTGCVVPLDGDYFWDKVQDGRITISIQAKTRRKAARREARRLAAARRTRAERGDDGPQAPDPAGQRGGGGGAAEVAEGGEGGRGAGGRGRGQGAGGRGRGGEGGTGGRGRGGRGKGGGAGGEAGRGRRGRGAGTPGRT